MEFLRKKFLRIFIFFISYASAVEINCEFKSISYSVVGSAYSCELKSDPSITSTNISITESKGIHQSSMNNEKVQGFYSESKVIHFMPKGLNKVFINLLAIYIRYGRIKEIHREHFEKYSKLRHLDFSYNDIEYLEKDIFKFNTELQVIYFGYNKLKQIYPTIFDHLSKLQTLYLDGNQCINIAKSDRSGVLELIKEVKILCSTTLVSDQLEHFNETNRINFEFIKNQFIEKSSKIFNLESETKMTFKNITDEIKVLIKEQDKIAMTKSNVQQEVMNEKFFSLEKNLIQQFFFIALPLICLFTAINIAMICYGNVRRAKLSVHKKSSQSNNVELEEINAE